MNKYLKWSALISNYSYIWASDKWPFSWFAAKSNRITQRHTNRPKINLCHFDFWRLHALALVNRSSSSSMHLFFASFHLFHSFLHFHCVNSLRFQTSKQIGILNSYIIQTYLKVSEINAFCNKIPPSNCCA